MKISESIAEAMLNVLFESDLTFFKYSLLAAI